MSLLNFPLLSLPFFAGISVFSVSDDIFPFFLEEGRVSLDFVIHTTILLRASPLVSSFSMSLNPA